MILKVIQPSYPLNLFVKLFTYFEGHIPEHSIERLLPDASTNMIIDLTDDPKYIFDNQTLTEKHKYTKSWFSGMQKDYLSISAGYDSSMFVIHFQPGGSYPFVGSYMAEFTNHVVDAITIFGFAIDDLRDAIQNEKNIDVKFKLVEAFLTDQLSSVNGHHEVIQYAVSSILKRPSQTSIHKLSHEIGYSQKQLIHLFKKYVGLTPKYFQRIVKFQHLLHQIHLNQHIDWTQLALDCGYYDQAHFINEFKHFSGFNPTQYIVEDIQDINYIPVK